MNPPMLDVTGNDFGDSLKNLAIAEKDINDKLGPIKASMSKLNVLAAECTANSLVTGLEGVQKDMEDFKTGNCEWSDDVCKKKDPLADLATSLSGLAGIGLDDAAIQNISSNLSAGIAECADKVDQVNREKAYNQCVKDQGDKKRAENARPCAEEFPPPAGVKAPASNCAAIARNIAAKGNKLVGAASGDDTAAGEAR
jgi:hypothetical protein